jgi:predicted Zn-dependent protease
MSSPDAQRALQGAQLGAKTLDVLDMENPARQQEIGQSVAVAITNRYSLSTNQSLNDYVNLVGLTVASVGPDPDTEYAFGVIESPQPNAYSAPGGYIIVTTGAIALMQDESELAGVLAHEVAHVAQDHGIEAVKAAKRTDLALSAAKTADQRLNAYSRAVDVATDVVLVKGYSRSQESQADAQAVKYLIAAGYDPNGLVRFLERMQSQAGSGGGSRQLMSTHPGTADRIASMQKQIASTGASGVVLKERFNSYVK